MVRLTYSTENLIQEDFITGINFNLSLLGKIIDSKPKYKEIYWLEDGVSIDGTIRIKSYHELLGKKIINTITKKEYLIDCVFKSWYYGCFWQLSARDENDSHATIYWENINSISDTILSSIKQNQIKFKIE